MVQSAAPTAAVGAECDQSASGNRLFELTCAAGILQGADGVACLSWSTARHFPTDLKLILKP